MDGISIKGHEGTFYVVNTFERNEKTYYLLESEIYGEDSAWLLTDSNCNLIDDNIYNGEEDAHEILEGMGL